MVERKRPPPTGCMSSMLQFFDLHRLRIACAGRKTPTATSLLPEQQQQHLHHQASQLGGVEALRNSLELDEAETAIREQYYGVPIGIQVARRRPTVAPEEEMQRKDQALTPRNRSVVAQLMGLEVLEYDHISSPRDSFSAPTSSNDKLVRPVKKNRRKKEEEQLMQEFKRELLQSPRQALRDLNPNVSGSISLPETPRPSSERAREIEPARFSLQHNKENHYSYTTPEFTGACIPRDRSLPVSPPLRTSKKVLTKKENLSFMEESKAKEIKGKINNKTEKKFSSVNHIKSSSYSKPEHKYLETTKRIQRNPSPASSPSTNLLKHKAHNIEAKPPKMEPRGKCTKATYDRFTEKIKRPAPDHLTMINQKLSQLNTNYNEAIEHPGPTPAKEHEPSGTAAAVKDTELKYVKAVLAHANVVGGAKAVKWFSPSLPIDPTIFHLLELRGGGKEEEAAARPGPMRHRWNRKLLFHLVEEIVGDLLLSEPNRWRRSGGEELLFRLWSRIKGLPTADCRVAGDIDALVAGDLPESKIRQLLRHPSVVATAQDVAAEIEIGIMDSLVGEIFR